MDKNIQHNHAALSSLQARHAEEVGELSERLSACARTIESEREQFKARLAETERQRDEARDERDELEERWLGMRDCYDREVLQGGRAEASAARAEEALRRIAEGNLGDEPWQANYERIREVARAGLAALSAGAEGTVWQDAGTLRKHN